jgi:wyosine [tRNA(Phe)-imidazoG37] synthetase (radical SAM superfamily)
VRAIPVRVKIMSPGMFCHIYGPVPSRRLGRSLGIDLVPFKTCTYDCVYCQLGRTTNRTLERKEYIVVEEVLAELERKLAEEDSPDYITIAGSGEPTLNSGIGDLIGRIKGMTRVPVAVLTNGSLLWMSEVQDALMEADLVLPSLDAGDEQLFRYVNRPHGDLSFERMVDGLASFTGCFSGEVWLEVLLLAGVTGIPSEAKKIAALAGRIGAARIQLKTVSRPPAEEFAFMLSMKQMLSLKGLFPGAVEVISEKVKVETPHLAYAEAGDEEVLALLSRRPCTFTGVADGLGIHVTEVIKLLDLLVKAGKVKRVGSGGRDFYTIKVRDEQH